MQAKTSISYLGNILSYSFNEVDKCPICKHAIKPVQLYSYTYSDTPSNTNSFKVVFTYLCRACNSAFIAQYENVSLSSTSNPKFFHGGDLNILAPSTFVAENFNEFITNTSPNFIKIYNQALAAESQHLDEIAGIGYRKALEFLIKDFLILKAPDKKNTIEKTPLGSCVNNYIDNEQLKIAASRAVWLGNDQTHYIQKFTNKDINDLKRLIRLTVHWISMLLETEEAATIEPIK